jgi:hypothetical protein
MGEERYVIPEIIMHSNATEIGIYVLDNFLLEYINTRSARCWHWELFPSLIVVAVVKHLYYGC